MGHSILTNSDFREAIDDFLLSEEKKHRVFKRVKALTSFHEEKEL